MSAELTTNDLPPEAERFARSVVRLTNDHWVSRGYQNNFASADKRVAVLDVATGRIAETDRPTKRNFAEVGFTSFVAADRAVDDLERGFAAIERAVLNQIRSVSARNRGPDLHAAIANLFAIHLVRSPSYKAFSKRIEAGFRDDGVAAMANDRRLPAMFEAQFGRPAASGELHEIALEQYDKLTSDPYTPAESMARQHNKIAEKLSGFHVQVIEIDPTLPGLVIGDTPIVHADVEAGRYGFRDSLALGDASLIVGPLTRRTAACFSAKPLAPVTIRTHKVLDALNAVFIRAATAEVACHPDDALRLQQVAGRLDRLPPQLGLHQQRRR